MEQHSFDPSEADRRAQERRRKRRRQWWQRFIDRRHSPSPHAEHSPEPTIDRPRQTVGRRVLQILGLSRRPYTPEGRPFLERGVVGHVRRATRAVLRLVIATEGRVQREAPHVPAENTARNAGPLRRAELQLRRESDRLDNIVVTRIPPAASPVEKAEVRQSLQQERPQALEAQPREQPFPVEASISLRQPEVAPRTAPVLEAKDAAIMAAGASLVGSAIKNEQAPVRSWALPKEFSVRQTALEIQRRHLEQGTPPVGAVIELATAQATLTRETADAVARQQEAGITAHEANRLPPAPDALPQSLIHAITAEQIKKVLRQEMQPMIGKGKEMPPAPTEQELTDRVERDPGRNWNSIAENSNTVAPHTTSQKAEEASGPSAAGYDAPNGHRQQPDPRAKHPMSHIALWWSIAIAIIVALCMAFASVLR